MNVLIDTNVVLDALMHREPRILRMLCRRNAPNNTIWIILSPET